MHGFMRTSWDVSVLARTKASPLARTVARHREQLTFVVVGGWNTLFGYAIWAGMQSALGDRLHYLVIVLLAWPVAVGNAYLCHRYITFKSHEPILQELPRFSMVYLVTLLFSLIALPIALAILPFDIYLTQAALTVGVIAASYVAHKYYSFGRARGGDGQFGSS